MSGALDDIVRMHEHCAWANRVLLEGLRALPAVPAAASKRFAHVLAAERLWLARLGAADRPSAVWPDDDLAQAAAELERLREAWRALFDELGRGNEAEQRARLARRVDYVNSQGERWSNTVADMLLHVPLHAAHHRGQITAELAELGLRPPYVDWIEAVRRGHVRGFDG